MNKPIKIRSNVYPSPLTLSSKQRDPITKFVEDDEFITLELKRHRRQVADSNGFYLSGPRSNIAYKASEVRAAIVTCGGLCPGLNDIIQGVVSCLHKRYHVEQVIGFQYGYYGLSAQAMIDHPPIRLTPNLVDQIHHISGSYLGSSRGAPNFEELVKTLIDLRINQLYCIGGHGTMKGAQALAKALNQRGILISVIGIPKTIDNDIPFVERTFGFETAVSMAIHAVKAAKAEASSALQGVGLVKLMGRHTGFMAANVVVASRDVDLVLVPELPFKMGNIKKPNSGILPYLKSVITKKGYAVVIVAEGVGQGQRNQPMLSARRGFDASGNSKLGDVGTALKSMFKEAFHKAGDPINLKYIDPNYMIRATTINSDDATYCAQLAYDAVHAAMAGYSELLIGCWGGVGTLIPFGMINRESKRLDLNGPLWRATLNATGQPSVF